MDVFELTAASRALLRAAAVQAAHRVGVFSALREPRSCEEVAALLGISPRRLRPLLDVLALERVIERSGPAFQAVRVPSLGPAAVPPQGPGRFDEVLRSDRPLAEPGVLGTTSDALARFHRHLAEAGSPSAAELAERIAQRLAGRRLSVSAAPSILDLGSGTGAFSEALLALLPSARATLVDRPEVLALAPQRGRQALLPLDLLSGGYPVGQTVVLLANLLHLFPPEGAARLIALAAASLAPGGLLVVKDLRVDEDRRGPPAGVYFALTMALYTDGGDVHPASAIEGWLAAAGLSRVERLGLQTSPDAWAFVATNA